MASLIIAATSIPLTSTSATPHDPLGVREPATMTVSQSSTARHSGTAVAGREVLGSLTGTLKAVADVRMRGDADRLGSQNHPYRHSHSVAQPANRPRATTDVYDPARPAVAGLVVSGGSISGQIVAAGQRG